MADPIIGLFMEDIAHERFITSLVERIASEADINLRLDVRNSSGGISRMQGELQRFLRDHTNIESATFDILIIVQDADREGETGIKSRIRNLIGRTSYPRMTILAVPDPYIEAWYLADPSSIQALTGSSTLIQIPQGDFDKNRYKNELSRAFPYAPYGGIEYADEIVANMNLYRASQNVSSLRHLIDDLRSMLTQLASNN